MSSSKVCTASLYTTPTGCLGDGMLNSSVGTNILNSQPVAIKFVRTHHFVFKPRNTQQVCRNHANLKLLSSEMSIGHTGHSMARVSVFPTIGGASAARCSGHPIPMGLSRPLHRVLPTIFCVSILSDICNTAGVPQVHYFGQEGLHNVLVIDLLGPNLEDLFDMCGRKFTIKTVCMAAKQMVSFTVPPFHSLRQLVCGMGAGVRPSSSPSCFTLGGSY